MKTKTTNFLAILGMVFLFACSGMSTSGYYVKYTDANGESVNAGGAAAYTYVGGTYINNFDGKVVQFELEDGGDFAETGMEGKTIKVLIYDTEKSTIWSAVDFDPEKTFTCKIKSFTYVKEAMMDDKEYKLVADFTNDMYKDGELSLKVNL